MQIGKNRISRILPLSDVRRAPRLRVSFHVDEVAAQLLQLRLAEIQVAGLIDIRQHFLRMAFLTDVLDAATVQSGKNARQEDSTLLARRRQADFEILLESLLEVAVELQPKHLGQE